MTGSAGMTTTEHLDRLRAVLDGIGPRIVACSGGVDSLVLATVAHDAAPGLTTVAHTVTPAVPSDGTARVVSTAAERGWRLRIVRSKEFDDERYLSNPTDRCYFCKSNLYDAIDEVRAGRSLDAVAAGGVVLSGANLDDLREYRPGLIAATEHSVRHPYVDAGIGKDAIRSIARLVGSPHADLPASPCLASRLYTGTRVTPSRLRSVEVAEAIVRAAGPDVVRCRIRDDEMRIEVGDDDRPAVTASVIDAVTVAAVEIEPTIRSVVLDERAYRPGRAIEVRAS